MICVLLLALAGLQIGVEGQKLGSKVNESQLYTHPETGHPVISGLTEEAGPVAVKVNKTIQKIANQRQQEILKDDKFLRQASDALTSAFKDVYAIVKEAEAILGPMPEEAKKDLEVMLGRDSGRDSTVDSRSDSTRDSTLDARPVSGRGKRQASSLKIPAPSNLVSGKVSAFWLWFFPCGSFYNLLFRTADGYCNNIIDPSLGQSFTPLNRCLPPAYDDGQQSPRVTAVSTNPLPSPRLVSLSVHPDKPDTSQFTIFAMLWGQFTDHDLVSTPVPSATPYIPLTCCGPNGSPPPTNAHPACFPITFPPGDPDFLGTCMTMLRSAPVTINGQISLPRENTNAITSFIDASNVYGSTQVEQDILRDPVQSHLLRTTTDNFPPDNGLNDCVKQSPSDICFLAGDSRVNENPGLALLHTAFLRYHNYIATELRQTSGFSDELVFQQARAIVSAVMQNIMYSEYLPIVLGPNVRQNYDLDFNGAARTNYDFFEDPRIFQAFSTAAYRFGHSMIPRSMPIESTRTELLRDIFLAAYETRNHMDSLTEGLLQATDSEDRSQPMDRCLVREVTKHLFENVQGNMKGFDLAALNINRGRDHGLPSYNQFRKKCGLPAVTDFCDPVLGNSGAALSNIYESVDDIDLFSGGSAEPPHDGGLVGETFSCLIGEQMHRLKYGDRFFFTHNRLIFGFTNQQVELLRGITLSHVLCMTTGVSQIQENSFRVEGTGNPLVECSDLKSDHPTMNNFRWYPFF